jgi:hypothetical protein
LSDLKRFNSSEKPIPTITPTFLERLWASSDNIITGPAHCATYPEFLKTTLSRIVFPTRTESFLSISERRLYLMGNATIGAEKDSKDAFKMLI